MVASSSQVMVLLTPDFVNERRSSGVLGVIDSLYVSDGISRILLP